MVAFRLLLLRKNLKYCPGLVDHYSIIGALSRSIHTVTDLVLLQKRLRLVGPVLDAPIRMEQQAERRLSRLESLSQGRSREVGIQILTQSPTDDATGEQIQDNGQKHVLPAHLDVGDIVAAVLIGRLWPGRFQSVVGECFGRVSALGHLPIDARDTRLHAPFPHQASHLVLADLNAFPS